MLFTSGVFWIFYSILLSLLFINLNTKKSAKIQNLILLAFSYFFYSYWDWRFLSLLLIVTIQTYIAGSLIKKLNKKRDIILISSLLVNLLILFFFKYANFFSSQFFYIFNLKKNFLFENIILPVGISFYIFQSFTYVLDIYKNKINPEENPINYFTFIAFFPQLVAGPIERASSLLPQFRELKKINPNQIYKGIKIIITGLFLKIFIADNIGISVDQIFNNYQNFSSSTLLLGAFGFSIQIYCDFSGYSLIAIGIAKIIGFNLTKNFNSPYFSISLKEFWKRWHISLSSFFRDYLYIPLGGNKRSAAIKYRNLILTFLASGIWHGANWTFILWGFLHGLFLILQKVLNRNLNKLFSWALTMNIVFFLWILFRSESIIDFYNYVYIIFSTKFGMPEMGRSIFIYAIYFLIVDLISTKYKKSSETWLSSIVIEYSLLSIMFLMVLGSIQGSINFIYFQF